jgi:hypothetical protein
VLCTDALVWALSMEETLLEEARIDDASSAPTLVQAAKLGLGWMDVNGFMDTQVLPPPAKTEPPNPPSALPGVVYVPSRSTPTVQPASTASASASATATPTSSALRRGRPKSNGPKLCHLCKSESNSQDPVQPQQAKTPASSSDAGSIMVTLKWAYPPVDGIPQGNYCWYCSKTVECKYVGQGLTQVKKLVDDNDTEKKTFFQYRNKVITMTIENGGHLTPSMVAPEDVMHYETESMHHKRHGKCMSVRKFQKKFGKKVDQKDAIYYKRCHRNVVEQIIVS